MTTITFYTDDFEEFIEIWKKNNPLDEDLSSTQIARRYMLKYVHDNKKGNKNEI